MLFRFVFISEWYVMFFFSINSLINLLSWMSSDQERINQMMSNQINYSDRNFVFHRIRCFKSLLNQLNFGY